MRAPCALLLRQLSLLLLLLLLPPEPSAGSGPLAASSRPPPRTRLSAATAAGPRSSSSRGASAAASRLPRWERERESAAPWAPPVSSGTPQAAAGGQPRGPVIGSSYQRFRSSDIEVGIASSPTDNMDTLTTFSRSGERTLLPITNIAMSTTATESIASYTEMIGSADLTQRSSSVEQSRRNISSSDTYFTEPGMEPLIAQSSEIPTYTSSQTDPPATGSSNQILSSWHMGKKTPSSHTDSVYISPTFSRDGERTLQLLTNRITSTDSLKITTSYTEIALSSDLTHSSASISQTGGSNRSSTITDIPESSTEPLLIHSPLKSDLPAIEGSHQPINSSESEKNIASSHNASMYISTTSTRAGERTLQSLINSSRSSDAKESATSGAEMSSSSYLTQSSSISSVSLTSGINISLDATDFTELSTDPLLTHSPSASETASKAIGSSHQPINSSATEKRTSDLHTTNTYISTTFIRGGERTLRSLTNSSTSPDVADSSTSNLENIMSSDLTQPSSSIAQTGGSNISSSDFSEPLTESLLTHSSKIPSYSSLPNDLAVIGSSHQPISSSKAEKGTSDLHTTGTYISTAFTRGGGRTLRSLTNSSTSPDAMDSSTSYLENTTSSDLTQPSSSVAQARGSNISSSDFSEPLTEPLLTHSSKIPSNSSSPSRLAAIGSSHQPISISATEKRTSDLHTTNTYISTTFTRGGERTSRSLTNNSTSPDVKDSSTSFLENTTSSDVIQLSTSVAQAGGSNVSSSDFMESSVEALLTHSSRIPTYLSSPSGLAAIGSSHQPISISATEKRTSDLHTTNTYISTTFTRGGERTSRSLTNNSTSPDVKDSSTSFLENTTSSDVIQLSTSVAQAGGSNVSSSDFMESSVEALLTHSSRIPTYLSSPSGLAAIGSSHQPISISATEKRTSDLHTTNTYISTTFTRGGERTSRSLTNNSTSPDVKDSSTSFLENTTSSDVIQLSTSVAQAGGSNVSSSDFMESSVEALLTHSSRIPTYLSSPSGLAAIGSSHQPISISATEKRTSDLHTTNTYISTTFTRGGERTSRSLTNNSTSPDVKDSSTSFLENTTSSDVIQLSTSVAQAGGSNVSSSDFMESSVEALLTHSSRIPTYLSSPSGLAAIGSSHQPISISATEKRTSDLHTTNTYISTTFTRGGERTSRSLTNNSTSPDVKDSSTSFLENTTSSDVIQLSTSVAQAGGSNVSSSDFMESSVEALLTHSSRIPTYLSSPSGLAAIGSSQQPISVSATEKRTSDLHNTNIYISTTFTRGAERTLRSLTNSSTSPGVTDSSTSYLEKNTSSDLTEPSSSVAQEEESNISSSDFSDPLTELLFTQSSKIPSYSSSPSDLEATGSSHQPINVSATEKRTSDLHTTNTYISTKFTRGAERTLRSLTNSSTSRGVTDSSTSYLENTTSSDLTSSVAQAEGRNVSSSDFGEPLTEPLLRQSSKIPSYSSSPNGLAAIGSSNQPISISSTEKRTTDLHNTNIYISTTFTRGGERTLRSLTNSSTSPGVTDSSNSYLEKNTSSDLTQPSFSIAQAGRSNISSSDFIESLTEPLLTQSSNISSYSSSPNGFAANGSSNQPISVSATEKRTSDLHTTDTYTSTALTRGAGRTLKSLINSSTSPVVTDSSTSYLENTTSSDVIQLSTSVAQAGGSNVLSSDFTESSVEALLTHSSNIPRHLSSPSGLAAIGSSHQPIRVSATEKRTSDLHTTNTYISTTFTRGAERTLRSLTNSSTFPGVTDSSTSYLENTTSSDLTSSVAQAGGRNISSSDFGEPLLTQSSKIPSYSSSPNGLAANGSSHQPISISATEKRTSDLHTTNTYISTTFTRGGERTLRSLTNSSTSPGVTDSSTSYLEKNTSSDLTQPSSSVAQAGGSNVSSSDFTIGSSHQPISISATEKRTSDLHTTNTYISSTFTRGGERTLRSLTNSSTLPDSAESFTSYLENSTSSDLTQPTSSVAQVGGSNVSSSDFTEPSTAPLLTHSSNIPSYSSSPSDLAAIGSSHQTISISATEKRTSDLHTTNTYISTTFIRGGERTPRSLTNSSTFPDVADSSTSFLENTTSSDLIQLSTSVAQAGGSNVSSSNFTETSTEPLLIHSSKIPSYSSSPNDLAATQSSHQPVSISATEKRDSDSPTIGTYFSTTFTRGGEKTLWSLTSSNTSPDKTENSTSNLENTRSSDLSQPSSSIAQTGGSNITSSDFTEPSTEPLLIHSSTIPTHSSSSNDLAGVGSSHQSVTISDREKRISGTPTHSMYVSTTFTRDGERTSQSLTHSSTWTAATEVSTHNTDMSKSSDSTQFLSSVSETGGFNVSSSDANFTEPSTESLLTHSSKISTLSSPNDASTIGSNHQSLSSSNTEKRMSSPYTDSMYSSATLTGGGERMLQSLTNSTSTHTTENSSSYTEITNSSELIQSSSVAQTRGTSISANDMAFTGSSTETFFIHSSKIPTYSSFQNDPSSIASSHQPVSLIDTGKRTSASRTDSMYISTTFNRGGERTLLSISNNSTSAESSESSTFYAEISNSSDLAQSSSFVAQGRGNNITSSDGDLIAPSTEPLLVHSSKMPAYSSTVNVQNTTLFYPGTESTGSSSSSSAFPSSSSVSSLYRFLSSTPSPPHSFESSESSLPSPSSVMPSSLPPPSLSSSLSTSSSVASSPLLSSLLPPFSSSSSSLQDGDRFQTSMSMVTSEGTHRMEPSTAVFYGSTPRQYSNHSGPHQLKESTSFKTTGPLPLQTEPMEQLSSQSSSTSASPLVTESSTGGTFTSKGDHFEKTTVLLTTAATSLSKNTQHTEMAKASTSILPNTTSQRGVELTGKTVTLPTDITFGPSRSVPSTDHSVTTKIRKIQTVATTTLAYVTGVTTKAMETSTTTSMKITEENIPATHPPKTSSPSKTTTRFSTTSAAATKPTTVALLSSTKALVTSSHTTVNVCSTNPCLHDGKCVINGVTGKYQCKCTPAWQGEDCGEDVDECLSNPCPALATCNNTQGSYVCRCPLGYQLEKGKCNLVRTFVDQVPLKLNITHGKYSELHRIEDEIITMLNISLSTLPGYYSSIVKATRESNSVRVSVQSTFSLASNVTFFDIASSVQSYVRACKSPAETCQFISSLMLAHRVGGLCKQKDPKCDRDTSKCTDLDGIAVCQCQSGYFKYNKMDHSCRACEDGFRLENETCVSCPFGLGGFNCRNPYQLITVVIAAAGGGLLLILGIALIITCCRKNKNDISKLIFKSGDFQMSPYAEYPKNPRAQDWARETIEMQENGSTKNLLQMTDVYYSPTGLRNAELERNGLYPPYTGLPGSRHSCIYPGQYNLSFISDETRRRDYF